MCDVMQLKPFILGGRILWRLIVAQLVNKLLRRHVHRPENVKFVR